MSNVFGVRAISEDAENQGRRNGGKAINTKSNVQRAPKRAALGAITNQVNQGLRVQPSRAAKPKADPVFVQDENAYAQKKTSKQPSWGAPSAGAFSIYVEPEAEVRKPAGKSSKLSASATTGLSEAVTALPQFERGPLTEREITDTPDVIDLDESAESPMVLDVSTTEEKKQADREAVILTVPEYEKDIYEYLRKAESKHRPKPTYMKRQTDITTSMRSILVDWLVEVSEEYKLHRETLFLAVNYIDRFLSKISVVRGKLQLVGAASMFLAAKYEEIYPPDVGEFVYITDDTYTKQQVLRMEHLILKVLTFDVAIPTTNWFCENFVKACDASSKLKSMTMFLSELTLVDMDTYIKYLPSVTAAAALCLARYSLNMEPWPESLVSKTGFEVSHFADCLKALHKTYRNADSHPQQAVVEKYKLEKFCNVSDFHSHPVPEVLTLLSV